MNDHIKGSVAKAFACEMKPRTEKAGGFVEPTEAKTSNVKVVMNRGLSQTMATTAIINRIFCMCPTPYALAGIIRSTFAKRTAPAILAHLYGKPKRGRG